MDKSDPRALEKSREIFLVNSELESIREGKISGPNADRVIKCANRAIEDARGFLVEAFLDQTRGLINAIEADQQNERMQAERSWARHRKELEDQKQIYEIVKIIEEVECVTHIQTPPNLNSDDMKLAQLWAGNKKNKKYWESAMISARRAEIVSIEIYKKLFIEADDIAIMQLQTDGRDSWMLADILSDGRLIDVKNSRRSFNSSDSYSEHCVPRFKRDRAGAEVFICGILSPYVKDEGVEFSAGEPLVWIGEARQSFLVKISNEYRSEYFDPQFEIGDRGTLLPYWAFEYPKSYYRLQHEVQQEIKAKYGIIDEELNSRICRRRIGILSVDFLKKIHCESGIAIEQRVASLNLSRPVLYLFILDQFCRCHIEGIHFPAQVFIDSLFESEALGQSPTFLYDPEEIILKLSKTLDQISMIIKDYKFVNFKLSRPGIFKGKERNGNWKTILAYCGGWKQLGNEKKVRCGKNPIVIGQCETCETCGYLICDACGFCQKDCRRYVSSQSYLIRND